VARGGAAETLEADPGDPRAPLAAALVPLGARGQAFGALVVASADPVQRYGPQDMALLSDVARRTAMGLEHARLYRAAHQAAQAREDFMQVASHELRGPVANFRLGVELLAKELARGNGERVEGRLRVLSRQADRLGRISGALLDVTRITAGRLTLLRQEMDLAALAREVVARHGEEAQAAGSAVTVEAPDPVRCQADPDRVEQVVANLLYNALKYGKGGPVVVQVRTEDGYAVLDVADRGIGIPPEQQARIFGRFERAVPPRSYGGLGLGLWIVRSLVEAHGGRIAVESAPGRGSTFTVKLPREGG
jgi:signal transduction histidine kinase